MVKVHVNDITFYRSKILSSLISVFSDKDHFLANVKRPNVLKVSTHLIAKLSGLGDTRAVGTLLYYYLYKLQRQGLITFRKANENSKRRTAYIIELKKDVGEIVQFLREQLSLLNRDVNT